MMNQNGNGRPILTVADYLETCVQKLTVAKNRVAASERDLAAYRRDRLTDRAVLAELENARTAAHAEFTLALRAWASAKGPTGTHPVATANFKTNSFNRDLDEVRRRDEESKP